MADMIFASACDADTEKAGETLAQSILSDGRPYAFVALFGEMGVGKTAFTRGFCRALGITGVHSPTYTVVNEYVTGTHPVFHFDMYRITGEDDLYSIGYEDYLARDGYILCEWSENIEDFLPTDFIRATITRTDAGTGREIRIEYPD